MRAWSMVLVLAFAGCPGSKDDNTSPEEVDPDVTLCEQTCDYTVECAIDELECDFTDDADVVIAACNDGCLATLEGMLDDDRALVNDCFTCLFDKLSPSGWCTADGTDAAQGACADECDSEEVATAIDAFYQDFGDNFAPELDSGDCAVDESPLPDVCDQARTILCACPDLECNIDENPPACEGDVAASAQCFVDYPDDACSLIEDAISGAQNDVADCIADL